MELEPESKHYETLRKQAETIAHLGRAILTTNEGLQGTLKALRRAHEAQTKTTTTDPPHTTPHTAPNAPQPHPLDPLDPPITIPPGVDATPKWFLHTGLRVNGYYTTTYRDGHKVWEEGPESRAVLFDSREFAQIRADTLNAQLNMEGRVGLHWGVYRGFFDSARNRVDEQVGAWTPPPANLDEVKTLRYVPATTGPNRQFFSYFDSYKCVDEPGIVLNVVCTDVAKKGFTFHSFERCSGLVRTLNMIESSVGNNRAWYAHHFHIDAQ